MKQIEDSFKRRDTEEASKKGKQTKDEDGDEDEEEGDSEDMVRHNAANVMSSLMKHHADSFVAQGLPMYLQVVQALLAPGKKVEDRQLGLFMCSIIGEDLGARAVPHWNSFVPQVLQDLQNEEPTLRERACYAVSFLGRESAFASQAADVATKLAAVITKTRAMPKKKSAKPHQTAADSAVSALGELLMAHEATLGAQAAQLWGTWVGSLPCQEDEAEGIRNHKVLLKLMQAQKPEVVAAGLPKLLAILIDLYKTDMSDDELSADIGKLLMAAGEAQIQSMATSFTEKQQKKIVRIFKEAQANK